MSYCDVPSTPRRCSSNTQRYVIRRSNSGSICDDRTRIWEDPPPPYSFEDPAKSWSATENDVFVPARKKSTRRSRDRDFVHLMEENEEILMNGFRDEIESVFIPSTELPSPHRVREIRGADSQRYLKLDDDSAKIEYLTFPLVSRGTAQKLFDDYRHKSIKNRFTVKKQKVRQVKPMVAYHYRLTSDVVERSQTKQCRPYRPGEVLSTPSQGKAPSLWKIHCNERDGERVAIPYTSHKCTCNTCGGTGTEMCHNCHGCGRMPCYHCNGDGRLTKTEMHHETFHDGRDPVTHCHTKSECCHHCYGQAMGTCMTCNGACRQKCGKCKGSKYLVTYQEMAVRRYQLMGEHYTSVPKLPDKQLRKCEGYKIFVDGDVHLKPVAWDDCMQNEIVKASKILLNKHSLTVGKIRRQNHCVTILPVTMVTMVDSDDVFWLLGKHHKPYVNQKSDGPCKIQ